jgi:hypothetical protein
MALLRGSKAPFRRAATDHEITFFRALDDRGSPIGAAVPFSAEISET